MRAQYFTMTTAGLYRSLQGDIVDRIPLVLWVLFFRFFENLELEMAVTHG